MSKDPVYENILKKFLERSEMNAVSKKGPKKTAPESSGPESQGKFFPKPNNKFKRVNPSTQGISNKSKEPCGNVNELLERLFQKHSSNVNGKLNTILQKVNSFSTEFEKLKSENKALQARNQFLMRMLSEKGGLKLPINGNLDDTFTFSSSPGSDTSQSKVNFSKNVPSKRQSLLGQLLVRRSIQSSVGTNSKSSSQPKPHDGVDSECRIRKLSNSSDDLDDISEFKQAGPLREKDRAVYRKPPVPSKESKQIPDNEYDLLVSLAEEKIIYAKESFTCENCNNAFLDCKEGDGVILHQCMHTFCGECLRNQILENLDEDHIRCLDEDCDFNLIESEIEALLTADEYEKRWDHAVDKIKDSMDNPVQCLTKGCMNIVDVEKGVYDFTCPLCKNVNCLDCRKIHPDGTTCRKLADLSAEEKLRSYETWESLNNDPLIHNTDDFECQICVVEYNPGEGVVLKNCLHMFCKECLKGHIENEEGPRIMCPYRDDDYSCNWHLQDREIKALISSEAYEKFLGKSIKIAEGNMKNTFHCLTPDCEYFCTIEDYPNFTCPSCHELNCIECKAIHTNKTCRQHKEDLLEKSDPEKQADIAASEVALNNLVAEGLAMICPNCGAHAMKEIGCDAIVCRCKTELCWATKMTRWGPRGTGDTSGGCKCGLNGRRCHPNCQNCH